MKRVVLSALTTVSAVVMTAAPAAAQSTSWFSSWWGGWSGHIGHNRPRSSVPEIDASTGLLALAAVGAALLLAWEIRRRRKQD